MVKISKVGISLPYYSTVNECVVNELVAVNEKKRARANETSPGPLSSEAKVQPTRVASVPTLSCNLQDNDRRMPLKKRMKRSESSMLPVQEHPKQKQESVTTSNAKGKMRPEECIKSIVQASGVSIESIKVDLNSFLPIEKQQHSSYPQAALAARNEDITSLKSLHKEGHNLQCSNKFGESIIHIICRRRRDDILNFLVSEAGVSLRLRDDLGRTPLHDAAWTDQPNFKVVVQLLQHEPDMIFVRDNRGNSPLSYIPRQNWGEWNHFLDQNKHLFLPATNDSIQ